MQQKLNIITPIFMIVGNNFKKQLKTSVTRKVILLHVSLP